MDHLLVQIAVLVFFARILGEIAKRLGQPAVWGELLAGIVRGSLRDNSGRAFLGQRAERLLKQSPCPILVLCSS